MPKPQKQTSRQHAAALLQAAQDPDMDVDRAATMRQEATVLAMLAIAEELDRVRESIGDVGLALVDNDKYGVGVHLHYISDWLERISKR